MSEKTNNVMDNQQTGGEQPTTIDSSGEKVTAKIKRWWKGTKKYVYAGLGLTAATGAGVAIGYGIGKCAPNPGAVANNALQDGLNKTIEKVVDKVTEQVTENL